MSPVNDPPEAQDLEVTLEEDGTVDVTLAGSDEDTPDEELSITIVESVSHGTLVPQGRLLVTYIYTPDDNYFGADTFTYLVTDGESSDTATVSIMVTSVNDAPVLTSIDNQSTDEDVPVEIVLSATDVDEDTLSYSAVSNTDNIMVSLTGSILTLTPAGNFTGSGEISVTANDGIVSSNTETFILTVDPVNDAPVALADSSNIFEDGSLTMDAPGVLSNDSDIEDDTLVAVLEGDVSHGVLTLNSDGSFVYTCLLYTSPSPRDRG